eukprot:501789-Prymnesium_polylepis.1
MCDVIRYDVRVTGQQAEPNVALDVTIRMHRSQPLHLVLSQRASKRLQLLRTRYPWVARYRSLGVLHLVWSKLGMHLARPRREVKLLARITRTEDASNVERAVIPGRFLCDAAAVDGVHLTRAIEAISLWDARGSE